MTIASVDAQLLSAHPPSQLEVTVFFSGGGGTILVKRDDFGVGNSTQQKLYWFIMVTILIMVIMVYNGYNGLL